MGLSRKQVVSARMPPSVWSRRQLWHAGSMVQNTFKIDLV
jgi:hypothetical protein